MPKAPRPLSRQDLGSDQATAALGVLVTKHLAQYGLVSLYLDREGTICVAPLGEITLDALPETMAIQELVARGYDDTRLAEYLEGRDARMGRA